MNSEYGLPTDPTDDASNPASDLSAYALGALDPEDAATVEQFVASNEDAARELDAMQETVAAMSMLIGTGFNPPVELKSRILDAVEADTVAKRQDASSSLLAHIERQIVNAADEVDFDDRSWYQKLRDGITVNRLAFATSIAAFMIAGLAAVQLGSDNVHLNRQMAEMDRSVQTSAEYANMVLRELEDARVSLEAAEQRMQHQAAQIENMSDSNDALRESFNDQISLTYATLQQQYQTPNWMPDSSAYQGGYGYLLESSYSLDAALVIGGVTPAPPGEEYRLYLVSGDDAEYVVSFNMNRIGYGTVSFPLPAPLSTYDGAHITRERVLDPPDPSLAEPANRYKPQ